MNDGCKEVVYLVENFEWNVMDMDSFFVSILLLFLLIFDLLVIW